MRVDDVLHICLEAIPVFGVMLLDISARRDQPAAVMHTKNRCRVLVVGIQNVPRRLVPAIVEEDEISLDSIFVAARQVVFDMVQQRGLVLQVDVVMQERPHEIDPIDAGQMQFPVIDDRVILIPLLGFVHAIGRHENRSMHPAPVRILRRILLGGQQRRKHGGHHGQRERSNGRKAFSIHF